MSYMIAQRVAKTHLNPYGLKPINRMVHATKKEAVDLCRQYAWRGVIVEPLDIDHEPGRTVSRTQCGP